METQEKIMFLNREDLFGHLRHQVKLPKFTADTTGPDCRAWVFQRDLRCARISNLCAGVEEKYWCRMCTNMPFAHVIQYGLWLLWRIGC